MTSNGAQTPDDVIRNREIVGHVVKTSPVQYLNKDKLILILASKTGQTITINQMSRHLSALDMNLETLKRDALGRRLKEIIVAEQEMTSSKEVMRMLAEDGFKATESSVGQTTRVMRKSLGKQWKKNQPTNTGAK